MGGNARKQVEENEERAVKDMKEAEKNWRHAHFILCLCTSASFCLCGICDVMSSSSWEPFWFYQAIIWLYKGCVG